MPPAIIITGVKAIDKKLRKLDVKVQKKVIRQSMRAGMKVMLSEVKSQVPVDSGLTKVNVKLRALKARKRNRIALEVRVAAAEGLVKTTAAGKRFFYPAGIEFGDSEHQPNPFARRSYTAKGDSAKNVAMVAMRDGVEREAKSS